MIIFGYSDAVFANSDDLSSQLGRVIFIVDTDVIAATIAFRSYKLLHVTRFVLGAEVISFECSFNEGFALKNTVEIEIYNSVQLHLLIDTKTLFCIISKSSRTTEKHQMLDVYAPRQS